MRGPRRLGYASLFERHVALRILRADVVGARADQAVVRVLLEHVRRPARDAADREDRREQIDRDAERVVGRRRIEVDVRVQLLLGLHQRLDALRHLEPAPAARRAGRGRATSAAGASRADPRCGRRGGRSRESSPCAPACARTTSSAFSGGASAPISSSSRMTSALAPPCSGPFRAPIARDDRRVDVGERRRGDARGERRRVQLVIGVQDQRDVERARRQRARPLAGQHVEEVRGVAEHRIRLDRRRRRRCSRPSVATSEPICAVSRTALR